ncbi:NAD-dependent epimerase/dehydratase family protein [Cyclobacteriaceae bacterium]|nr:NAD-dependent epimerase/dehydratase family protein [Cyclobacteriaceae bacterium]MDB4316222.1 NAD-dependent epimerase/dehydratase family protein [Cyclobacteriaceae bacterium]
MFINRPKILISGGGGFIGQHLLNNLIKENCELYCLVRNSGLEFIKNQIEGISYYDVDLKQKESLHKIVKSISPDFVIHLAGVKSRSNKVEGINNILNDNIFGTLNLFESLLAIPNLKQITVLGSVEEYGFVESPFKENSFENPVSIYGVSKLSISKLAKIFAIEHQLPITILRSSVVYGPKQGTEMFIPSIINALSQKKLFSMTKGEQYRDFIFIDDLIEAIKRTILIDDVSGLIINIASGISYKLSDIAKKISKILNGDCNLQIGALEYRKLEIMNYSVDITLASLKLNWKPSTSIDKGLVITIDSLHE